MPIHFPIEKIDVIQYRSPTLHLISSFNLLIDDLNTNHGKGYSNYIACASEQQAKRFHDIFEDVDQEVHYKTIVLSLYQGFIDHDQ